MRLSTTFRVVGSVLLLAMSVPGMAHGQPRSPGAVGSETAPSFATFERMYRTAVERSGIVGSGFAFVHEGRVIHESFAGVGNVETKRPVDDRTIFHWASITKTFTAIAIMQLRDRGRLKLEDPIVNYIPELRQVHDPYGDISEITLEHLLSHRAGFRSGTWPWGGDKPWHPHEPRSWQQLAAMLPYTEIEFKPGSKYNYSNPGIVFLGRVIELVSGDDYEVYIDKNILKPLQMYDTYFDATPYHLLPFRSASYNLTEKGLTPARFDVDTGITASNGGLNAPIRDMVKYLSFLIGAPASPAKQAVYDGILKRSSLEEMWQPRAEVQEGKTGKDRRDFVALSFFIEDNYGMRFIAHSGHQNSFVTHLYLNPALRAAYVVAFNTYARTSRSGPADTDRIDGEVKEHLFANVFPSLKK